jgi:DNA-binding CsgD family transcriptional regulator
LQSSGPDDLWAAVVNAEPEPRRTFGDKAAPEDALAGFGDAADLKSPWFSGHSGGVARLAGRRTASPGGRCGADLPRAGLVHDLGRVAVPAGIWERPGPLRPEQRELVRLHPYHQSAPGALPGPGSSGPDSQPSSRARRRVRLPGRGARLRAGRRRWRARATLPPLPADLTERELEVLRWLVAGRTKREIAAELVISPSTVHTHTVHIYAKCAVSTRAALAMFAMQHGLMARTG